MTRATLLTALLLSGCASPKDKPIYWMKANYNAAQYERDKLACTDKAELISLDCMKLRGYDLAM